MKPDWLTTGTIIGALATAFLLLAFVLSAWLFTPTPPAETALTAVTLLPAPTSTPAATPTWTPDARVQATATALPGQIAIGLYVQISGTEGDGLRIRETPGLSGRALFLGFDSEVFQIQDGPAVADGYTWWQIQSPYDTTRGGWAVANYLEVVTP